MVICIAPVILFLVLVTLVPLVIALTDSLKNLSLTDILQNGEFIGLDNFRTALASGSGIYNSLWLTLVFVAVSCRWNWCWG